MENGVGTRPGCLFCNGTVDMVLEPVRGVVGLGIGAPEYLSIAGHQDCLGTYQPSPSYTANCLPSIKPSRCTSQAWTELGQKYDGEKCPDSRQPKQIAVTLPAVIGRNSMGQATPVTLPAIVIDREGDKLDPCLARRPPTEKGPCGDFTEKIFLLPFFHFRCDFTNFFFY